MNIQKYVQVIRIIHTLCQTETPIKLSEFMKNHKISNYTFEALRDLGIIKEIISNKREGYIFEFKKMAENETFSHIAQRVCDHITEIGHEAKERAKERQRGAKLIELGERLRSKKKEPKPKVEAPEPEPIIKPEPTVLETKEESLGTVMHTGSFAFNGPVTKKQVMEYLMKVLPDEVQSFTASFGTIN